MGDGLCCETRGFRVQGAVRPAVTESSKVSKNRELSWASDVWGLFSKGFLRLPRQPTNASSSNEKVLTTDLFKAWGRGRGPLNGYNEALNPQKTP